LKPGKGISLRTKSTDRHNLCDDCPAHDHVPLKPRLLGVFALLVLASLACSVGILSPDDPIFTAPGSGWAWTPTPPLIFPTDHPSPTPSPDLDGALIGGGGEPVTTAPAPTPGSTSGEASPRLYDSQAGDTLPVVAVRFGVDPSEITSPLDPLPEEALLPPHTLLIIPDRLANTTSPQKILPDSEIVFSPSAVGFDVGAFVAQAGGYLATYRDWLGSTQWTSGADIITRVARENSINPRLLLALLEYQSGWVYGQPVDLLHQEYPMGKVEDRRKGLYQQLVWAVNQLSIGYYGWREGLLTVISFSDGVTARLAPDLNAGTVAMQYYLAQVYDTPGWVEALNVDTGLPSVYERMFGSPWVRAMNVEPLYPTDLTQPKLILPFLIGQIWSYTGGPHGAWEHDGARAALDFAPGSVESGCVKSDAWVVASASGLIVRSDHGVILEDLDGDGLEQTGWVLLYLHVSDIQVQVGDWVETSDLLGHPSCEGGIATGTHVHIARKYNGEWIPADGPLPFVLSGWQAHAGADPYQGTLTRDGVTISSSIYGSYESLIKREREEP
jgi:LasA protease